MRIAWLLCVAVLAACRDEAAEPTSQPAESRAMMRPTRVMMRPAAPPEPAMLAAADATLASLDPEERERAVLDFEGELADPRSARHG